MSLLIGGGLYIYFSRQKSPENDSDQMFIEKAEEYLEEMQYSYALEQYKSAINADPTNTDTYIAAAKIYILKSNDNEALTLLQNGESVVVEPDKVFHMMGQIFFNNGELQKAITTYEKAYKKNKKNYENAIDLALAYTTNPEKIDEAKSILSKIDSTQGELYAKKHYYLALLSYEDIDSVIENIEKADSEADEELKGILASFLDTAKKVKKDAKNAVQNNTLIAFELLRAKMYNLAIPLLDTAISQNDEYYAAYMYRGICHMNTGDIDKAQEDLEKAVTIDPIEVEPWLFLAQVYTLQNNQKDAVESFEEALTIDSKNEQGRYDLALTLIHFGQYRQARLEYKKLLEMESTQDLTYRIELAYIDLDQLDELTEGLETAKQALEHYEQQLTTDKESLAEVEDLLGWAHLINGQNDAALSTLEKAINTYPYLASTYFHLGMLYKEVDSRADAQTHFERAIDLDTEGDISIKAKNELDKLQDRDTEHEDKS